MDSPTVKLCLVRKHLMQKVATFWVNERTWDSGLHKHCLQTKYVVAGAPFMGADTHSYLIFVLAGSTMAV